MILGTWNINNRVGKKKFRLEAAYASVAINADVLVLTEFYPRDHEEHFRSVLSTAGWPYQLISAEPPEIANRVLIVSKLPIIALPLDLPLFDHQFPANLLAISIPSVSLNVLGIRVPAYSGKTATYLSKAWDWLEAEAETLRPKAAVILGDLNVSMDSRKPSGESFRRILSSGWRRAEIAESATFFGHGGRSSEIDHILATDRCILSCPRILRAIGGYELAGSKPALSDHAALICDVNRNL